MTPHIEAVFRFSQLKQALSLSHAGRARGKIVLAFGGLNQALSDEFGASMHLD